MEVLKGGKLTSTSFIFILVYLRLFGAIQSQEAKKKVLQVFSSV